MKLGAGGGNPTIAAGVAYVGTAIGVVAVKISDGSKLWTFKTSEFVNSNPLIVNGKVAFGCYDKYFYVLDATTGNLKWKYLTGGLILSSPTVLDLSLIHI